jgi:hypothetical protein
MNPEKPGLVWLMEFAAADGIVASNQDFVVKYRPFQALRI